MATGQYKVISHCTLGKSGLAGARVDIAADKGKRVLAECTFGATDESGCFVMPQMLLNAPCDDLVVRV